MDDRLATLLLIEEWKSRPIWPTQGITGRREYLIFVRSQPKTRSRLCPYARAVRQIEGR